VTPVEELVAQTKAQKPILSEGGLLRKVRSLLLDGGWGTDRLPNGELKELAKVFSPAHSATLAFGRGCGMPKIAIERYATR
jgi:hypothetical protein